MKSLFGRSCSLIHVAAALFTLNGAANATTVSFLTDPFEGSTALITPGRQVVGGEPFIPFNIATDVFAFNPAVFAIGTTIQFANGVAGALPIGGVNVIVLQSFDNDANPTTPFGAGNAADLIAAQITQPGPGFFIYFNQGLDLPRLVYSTDLNDSTSDLKILARITNLSGQAGRDAFPSFTAANFQIAAVPESASLLTLVIAAGFFAASVRLFRRRG